MARFDKPPSDPRGGHIRLYWDIMDSNAWRCLSKADKSAYLALQRHLRSTNNGDLSLPLSVARQHGIASSATLAKSLRALVAVGLLAVTRKGGCSRGGQKLPTLYRFTDRDAYAVPMKHIESAKATNEWKLITTLGRGREAIRQAEADAEKTQLQKLAVTASKIEVVRAKTTSKNEVGTALPRSNIEAGEKLKTVRKANTSKGFKKSSDLDKSENHTSNNEVLSTVAIPTGESGLPGIGITAVSPAWAGLAAGDVLATAPPDEAPAMISASHPGSSSGQQRSTSGTNSTRSDAGNVLEASPTERELVTATDEAGEDF